MRKNEPLRLFLCGDVMIGRGIDQILPFHCDPTIFEPYSKDARDYVRLAEKLTGPIPSPVSPRYIWGDALDDLDKMSPDLRIINLETAITNDGVPWPGKGINYRTHPKNVSTLIAARVNCSALANNHTLDWGYAGLEETLLTLKEAGIEAVGAGKNGEEAETPAIMDVKGKGRVLVFSFGSEDSGIPEDWAAREHRPGINLLPASIDQGVSTIRERVDATKAPGDIAVLSVHWGGNWGYRIPEDQVELAHSLIDVAGIDIVHGHSSHHVKGIEVYRQKLILYGCGDFLTDYEGIAGYKRFRPELGLMYFAEIDPAGGKLESLKMIPTRVGRFQVNRALPKDAEWIADLLSREGKRFGTSVEIGSDKALILRWKTNGQTRE